MGVKDADVIAFIDTEGYAGLHAACWCNCSIGEDGVLGYPEESGEELHEQLVPGRLPEGTVAIYPFRDDVPYRPCPQMAWSDDEWASRITLPFPGEIYGEKYVRPL